MIVVTGAAGFIGSCLLAGLRDVGYADLVAVDDFSRDDKLPNLRGKPLTARVHRDEFIPWLRENQRMVQFVFHLGARTDTTESDRSIFQRLNIDYSKRVWECCAEFGLPLVYASSAATYGLGDQGFEDNHSVIQNLAPLNPYGESKNAFDLWAIAQPKQPPSWQGLKFFNVYGPNEYHKGRMASVVLHAFAQIRDSGAIRLFRSHHPDYADGGQLRDFIYVKDVVDVCLFLMENRGNSGIYNLGTGRARTFLDLARAIFAAMGKREDIRFIDTPADIRDRYQYFTEARMAKLQGIGYDRPFTPIEEGVRDYVTNYLMTGARL